MSVTPGREGDQAIARGLRADSLPMRLYEKSKRHGIWNPSSFDFVTDREQWTELSPAEQRALLVYLAQFGAGEEAVTLDLLPMVLAVAREGRLDEELYLTAFLFEEGKHTQFFRRWLDEVADSPERLDVYHLPSRQRLFDHELPQALGALLDDSSPEAMARAAVTYNMVVEGVVGETAYYSLDRVLHAQSLMPGLCSGLIRVKQDEARHIAYGVYLISRLVAEKPDVWGVVEERMQAIEPLAIDSIRDGYRLSRGRPTLAGLDEADAVAYGRSQFEKRYERLRRGCDRSLAEIEAAPEPPAVHALATEI